MIPDFFWIGGPWRGRLAIAARPRGGDWLEDEIISWRRAGIDVVVSLLENGEEHQLGLAEEQKTAETDGLSFLSFPIPDRGVPASVPDALTLMSDVSGALDNGKNVALHCRQSIGRSGLIAAGILVASGVQPERAIEIVSTARGLSVPETLEQRLWVQRLQVQRLPSKPAAVAR
jgi:protein-tyrosine phosphatase